MRFREEGLENEVAFDSGDGVSVMLLKRMSVARPWSGVSFWVVREEGRTGLC